jgi:hypothetical protein
MSLDDRGVPKIPLIIVNTDLQGKKFYEILGPSPLVEKKQKEIKARNPKIGWQEKDARNVPPPEWGY